MNESLSRAYDLAEREGRPISVTESPLMGVIIVLGEPTSKTIVANRSAVNRKGWISGWGTVMQQGHATFYGEVRTELCGGVPMVYLLLPEIEATADREGLPEQEVFFPLSTLYRFTPTAEHEVIDARRAQAPLKMEMRASETTRLRIKASDEAEALYLRLLSHGRTALTPRDIDKLTPAGFADLTAWANAGSPDPAPSVYDEDVPF